MSGDRRRRVTIGSCPSARLSTVWKLSLPVQPLELTRITAWSSVKAAA